MEWPPPSAEASAFMVQGVLLGFLKPRPLLFGPLLLVLLLFPASPRSQGLREASAPDASGLLKQLVNCCSRKVASEACSLLEPLQLPAAQAWTTQAEVDRHLEEGANNEER